MYLQCSSNDHDLKYIITCSDTFLYLKKKNNFLSNVNQPNLWSLFSLTSYSSVASHCIWYFHTLIDFNYIIWLFLQYVHFTPFFVLKKKMIYCLISISVLMLALFYSPDFLSFSHILDNSYLSLQLVQSRWLLMIIIDLLSILATLYFLSQQYTYLRTSSQFFP